MNRIPLYGQIKGCTIYPAPNGKPAANPAAIDCTITLPNITFETGTVQMMGSLTVPDQSRLGDLSMDLSGKGLKEYAAKWVREVTDPNGAIRVVGFTCYFAGYVTQVPQSAKNPGAESTGDYNVSLVRYQVVEDGNKIHFDIDRAAGKLIINGEDYRSEVDKLL